MDFCLCSRRGYERCRLLVERPVSYALHPLLPTHLGPPPHGAAAGALRGVLLLIPRPRQRDVQVNDAGRGQLPLCPCAFHQDAMGAPWGAP